MQSPIFTQPFTLHLKRSSWFMLNPKRLSDHQERSHSCLDQERSHDCMAKKRLCHPISIQINVWGYMTNRQYLHNLTIYAFTLHFKGILWDRRWSTPSIRIFLRKCIFNHETKQASKSQSDPSTNCFKIDIWNINCWRQQFISYLSYCFFVSHSTAFYMSSVVFWDVIFWE